MDMPRRAAIVVAVLLLASACLPSRPSAADWHEQASQALEDAASSVATAQLVMREQRRDHLLGRSGTVMLVEAEEAIGTTAQTLDALQPPEGLTAQQSRVSDALQRASGLITDARIARVREHTDAYRGLEADLRRERDRLTRLSERMR